MFFFIDKTISKSDANFFVYSYHSLQDHVNAVTDVDYSPTGKEIVSSSYDRTIRIFNVEQAHSREIYHTKRMQHVTCIGESMSFMIIKKISHENYQIHLI